MGVWPTFHLLGRTAVELITQLSQEERPRSNGSLKRGDNISDIFISHFILLLSICWICNLAYPTCMLYPSGHGSLMATKLLIKKTNPTAKIRNISWSHILITCKVHSPMRTKLWTYGFDAVIWDMQRKGKKCHYGSNYLGKLTCHLKFISRLKISPWTKNLCVNWN